MASFDFGLDDPDSIGSNDDGEKAIDPSSTDLKAHTRKSSLVNSMSRALEVFGSFGADKRDPPETMPNDIHPAKKRPTF